MNLPGERSHERLRNFPPVESWDHHVEYDAKAHPRKVPHEYMLVPTTCFNCESACGLLAYVDKSDLTIKRLEGNPAHPGSRGRNCAKGPATINQVNDPERILHPLRRVGERGSGHWEQVSWDEALDDIAARIRAAIVEDRRDEVIYHVGRPGEDGFAERFLLAWGVDGHNSHTNICSAGARLGYSLWGGYDRPSPDYANAKVILLISSHLEAGHYFNPHAQRIMEGKVSGGAKVVVLDPRLSNTASHADLWMAPWPGSEAAILLSVASYLLRTDQVDRAFIRRWVNWSTYMQHRHPELPADDFDAFMSALTEDYAEFTFAYAAQEAQVPEEQVAELARVVATAGSALSAHVWRAATAGNLGGWQVSRALFFLNVLTGSVGTKGGTSPNGWDKIIAHGPNVPEGHDLWNELLWPRGVPDVDQRDVDPAAAPAAGRPRQARDVLLPGLQPGVDQPRRVQLARGAHRRVAGRVPRRTHADLVGDRDLRRLRAADGPQHRAARHPVLRAVRRQVARLPPARHPGGDGEDGASRLGLPRVEPGPGVGGERVLVRPLVADRPRRVARHPQVLRVAVPAGREGHRRRVLPLGLREQRPRPAEGGGRRGA